MSTPRRWNLIGRYRKYRRDTKTLIRLVDELKAADEEMVNWLAHAIVLADINRSTITQEQEKS